MAGPTTAGLAALNAGESWHYVGAAGEPAFENDWDNWITTWDLAFRIGETGVVDIEGSAYNIVDTTDVIFTLPEGYRPSNTVRIPQVGTSSALGTPTTQACTLVVLANGQVKLDRWAGGVQDPPETVDIYAQVFLNPPGVAP